MKKVLLSFALMVHVFLSAGNAYYYYNGNRISLSLNEDSVVVYYQDTISKAPLSYTKQICSLGKSDYVNAPCVTSVEYIINGDSGVTVRMSNRFYVKLFDSTDYEKLREIAKAKHVILVGEVPYMTNWYELVVDKSDFNNSLEMSNYFYETGLFENIDPGFVFNFSPSCVTDNSFSQQWGLAAINACDAWAFTKGRSTKKVAIIDTGIYKYHSEFSTNQFVNSYDCSTHSTPSNVYGDHGTRVCGVIASGHNNYQIAGVAPNVKIMPISYSLTNTDSLSANLASGIGWAVSHGADVINCSWGDQNGQYYSILHSSILESALYNALTSGRSGKGCVVVFASGNANASQVDYPGYVYSDILTVGAVEKNNSIYSRATYSSYGNYLDVVAPGTNIKTTDFLNTYVVDSGTSFAAPHASGLAALILSINSNLTQNEVVNIIESTAQKVGSYNYTVKPGRPNGAWNKYMGYGMINAYDAIMEAQQGLIYGPDILMDSAYYFIQDVPQNATIQWTLNNVTVLPKHCEIVSGQGTCSVYVALRPTNSIPPVPLGNEGDNPNEMILPNVTAAYTVLGVTVTYNNDTYSLSKTIYKPESSLMYSTPPIDYSYRIHDGLLNMHLESADLSMLENRNVTLELWHNMYGCLRMQTITNNSEQIELHGLPQGIYVLIIKDNDVIVNSEKILVK